MHIPTPINVTVELATVHVTAVDDLTDTAPSPVVDTMAMKLLP